MLDDPEKSKAFDIPDFLARHSKTIRRQEVFACAQALKREHGFRKLGAVGFCYGGWAVFQLGAKGNNLVDCVSAAHPSMLDKTDIANLGVPVQILAPEIDPVFTPELKEFSQKTIPTLGVEYDYQHFPGLEHGFSVRGDVRDEKQKKGLERAKNAAVGWFVEFLH